MIIFSIKIVNKKIRIFYMQKGERFKSTFFIINGDTSVDNGIYNILVIVIYYNLSE